MTQRGKLKRLLLWGLLLMLILPYTTRAEASNVTCASNVTGNSYTNVKTLANALDAVFSGVTGMYSDAQCTARVSAPLGSNVAAQGKTYYVKDLAGNLYSGTSCYIYANGVYAYLFGDVPYHGYSASWQHSRCVLSCRKSASYDLFSSYAVKTGALLRTTANSDGSYNGNKGHSIIVLRYDKDGITYLDGNGDGKGLISVRTRTWSNFNDVLTTGRGYMISFIVQPTEEYYASLSATRPSMDNFRQQRIYSGAFSDVKKSSWYYSSVVSTYEKGLMSGKSAYVFDPAGDITWAQGVAVAARLHAIYYGESITTSAGAWYSSYVNYAYDTGIISTKEYDWSAPIQRGDFAVLMASALPDGELEQIKTVNPDDIADVDKSSYISDAVYKLYRAGVLTGTDSGDFRPHSNLTRAQAAAVLARMSSRSMRIK